ncbi:MAG: dTMP kinase [Calditrichaeota bacterium]|nr:MAG: dTMP kinase [Calditrichota bacterium]
MKKQYKNFISFEGIDFSGKTTQISSLLPRFEEVGISVEVLREPGGTLISEEIRSILLNPEHHMMHPRAEILLYSAARAQLVHEKIIPMLENGQYIIADRFFDSTTAYQGYGRKLDIQFVHQLNSFATSGVIPYKTFFIDITPREAYRRHKEAQRGRDRLEKEEISFYEAIREGFLKIAKENPERFIVIDGERPIHEVTSLLWSHIKKIWNL